ncbi:hypothetical protein KP803_09515 [Vibrio sp. ZSDE26]|uniref:Uncharacterized protein n=1 Tax=Vibrio amylolyticus TaxID=2847292 RepID=A0A9X2BH69_9VIBR|nr:hypothetical protein [Vibrio amylolyticus]MCK6263509.1 hypothetical protein [Vibrio amylolyticus]
MPNLNIIAHRGSFIEFDYPTSDVLGLNSLEVLEIHNYFEPLTNMRTSIALFDEESGGLLIEQQPVLKGEMFAGGVILTSLPKSTKIAIVSTLGYAYINFHEPDDKEVACSFITSENSCQGQTFSASSSNLHNIGNQISVKDSHLATANIFTRTRWSEKSYSGIQLSVGKAMKGVNIDIVDVTFVHQFSVPLTKSDLSIYLQATHRDISGEGLLSLNQYNNAFSTRMKNYAVGVVLPY